MPASPKLLSHLRGLAAARKGVYHHSPETREKIARAHRGKTHVGTPHTAESRRKIGLALRGKTWTLSESARRNHAIGKKRWWDAHPEMRVVWSVNQKGAKGSNWQGGKTALAMRDRRGIRYAAWRKSVFERDKYTCQHCGQIGGRLNADHIMPYSQYPELRLKLSNGRTLCLPCHRKTPTWGGLTRFKKKHVQA